ncbi:MAG: hypothetical protein H6Q52_535 [Deltaproteobacteria bacterium]|nr:hypothetical protein [Deltaproteobacteria bacterium]
MITGLENRSLINTGNERTQAMTLYVRAFFRSIDTESFARLIAEAGVHGQQRIVEELYSAGAINNIVATILRRIDSGHYIGDQINDYIQDATVVLMQIARQDRLDLKKSAGEIASYICLWIEQRVKRVARKDQRWRFSLSDSPDDIEKLLDTDDLQLNFDETQSGNLIEPEVRIEDKLPDPSPAPLTKSGFNPVGYNLMKSERNILSIFGSSRSNET